MRGGSSIRQHKEAIETDSKVVNKDEPHLSGAYIRSLVKQLTSSRTKDPMDPKHPSPPVAAKLDRKGLSGGGENQQAQQPPPPPPPHKKQVRRRLHTSRPYQERLLNMAEARREIVTALKYHRAAMKQANEQQQQLQQQPVEGGKDQLPCYEQEPKVKSRRNPRTYPSSSGGSPNFCNNNYHYVDNFSSSSNNLSHPLPPPPSCSFPWTNSPILPPPPPIVGGETLNFPLPNQPLGLNLNIQDFNNIDTSTLLYHNNSPSTSSPCFSFNNNAAAAEEVPNLQFLQQQQSGVAVPPPPPCSDDGFHHVLDDEEMAEMRSIGEQHQVEWNDTMNLVTSAWWFKFMKTVDLGPDDQLKAVVADDHEIMEFPPWFNPANDATLLQQQHCYDCPQDYSPDPTLPCMDIGEIEGMEGEWWA